jgi:hypothetical protein
MAIIRIHTGSDGKSHFEEIAPRFEPRADKSESAELIPGSGIVIRRFDANRSNPWHHAGARRSSRCPAQWTSRSATGPCGVSARAIF